MAFLWPGNYPAGRRRLREKRAMLRARRVIEIWRGGPGADTPEPPDPGPTHPTRALIRAMPTDSWLNLVDTNLSAVYPTTPNYPNGSRNIFNAWCGAVWIPNFGSHGPGLLVWGGGHQDYDGNELYFFSETTWSWIRITDPFGPRPIPWDVQLFADGTPSPRHTYGSLCYELGPGNLISFGGAGNWGDGNTDDDKIRTYLVETDTWRDDGPTPPGGGTSQIWETDPETGLIWGYMTGGLARFCKYEPGVGYTEYGSVNGHGAGAAAIDSAASRFCSVDNWQTGVHFWNLSDPGAGVTTPALTGSSRLLNTNAGLAFRPVDGRYYLCDGGANVDRFAYNSSTVNIEALSPTGDVPVAGPTQGTYGRFRYIESEDVFIAANDTESNVSIYKPPAVT